MKLVKNILVSAAIAVAVSGSAMAANTAVSAQQKDVTGAYVTGNVGYGRTDLTNAGKNHGITFGGDAGYRFDNNFALEAGYLRLPKVRNGVSRVNNYHVDVKATYPISSEFDAFAKLGGAYVNYRADVTGTIGDKSITQGNTYHAIVPMAGLGVDYNVAENIAVTTQAIAFLKSDSKGMPGAYVGLVGLTYKF